MQSIRQREYDSLSPSTTFAAYPYDKEITTAASVIPVSLSEVKNALLVYDANDDTFITNLIWAVAQQIESITSVILGVQTIKSYYQRNKPRFFLEYRPINAITSIVESDGMGNSRTLTLNNDYYVYGGTRKEIYVRNQSYPFLEVTFEAGYSASTIPYKFRQAIIQEVSFQYKNRQDPDTGARVIIDGFTAETESLLKGERRYL